MRCFFCFLLILSVITAEAFQSEDPSLLRLFELAVQSRPETSCESNNQKAEETQNVLLDLLEDYSVNNSLESSIELFIRRKLQLSNFYIKNVRSLSEYPSGKTMDEVFIVFEAEGKPVCVVKAFPKTTDRKNLHFIRELSAFHFFRDHFLKCANLEKPLAAGKCFCLGTEIALLAKTYCPGKALTKLAREMRTYKSDGKKLSQSKEISNKIMKLVGRVFGELHSMKKQGGAPETKLTNQVRTQLSQAISTAGGKIPSEDLERIETYVLESINQYLETPIDHTYTHGDPNFGNILYDSEEDVLSLIDISGFHKSISNQGDAMGYGSKEFAKIEHYIERLAYVDVPLETITDLKKQFREGYLAYMDSLPPEEQIRFYKICSLLKVLTSKLEMDGELAREQLLLILKESPKSVLY